MSAQAQDIVEATLVDRDAEREVLGGCFVKPELMTELELDAGDFFVWRHRLIWSAMQAVHEAGIGLDLASVREQMQQVGTYERIGASVQALSETLDRAGYSWNTEHYAKKLRRLALERNMAAEQVALRGAISDSDHDRTAEILRRLGELRDQVLRLEQPKSPPWAQHVVDSVEATMNPSPLDLIPLGLSFLDEHMGGGAERGWLIVVMGPAKSGKTALAVNTMAVAAVKAKKRVLVISLEMSIRDNVRRFLARESGVPTRAQRKGDLTLAQQGALTNAGDEVARWSIEVRTGLGSMAEIAAVARAYHAEHGLDELVVDYVQLVDNGLDNNALDVQRTTRGMKLLCLELDCVGILLSQPNNTDAKSGEVGLFSGKGSGAIAADCDAMIIPLRDADDPTRAGLWLAGARHEETHKWPLGSLVFDGARMVFREPGISWRPFAGQEAP